MLNNSRDIISRLEKDGFMLKSVKGSHHKFVHTVSKWLTIVPHPKRDIPLGTVYKIYKDAGWKKD